MELRYRVNRAGQLNSPFGRYKNPNIVNEDCLRSMSTYFNENDIQFQNTDYAAILSSLDNLNAFVYLDPPYDPTTTTSNFTGYTSNGFSRLEQIRLKASIDNLNRQNIKFMLSNSATPFILDLYKDYNITTVKAKRFINSKGNKRGDINEVVIRNYD